MFSTSSRSDALTSGSLLGWSIEPETSIRKTRFARRPVVLVDRPAQQTDSRQPVRGIPGAAGDLDIHRERVVAGRGRVVIREIVQQFLDPDRILGGELILIQEPPDVGVTRRVDVDRERRERLLGDADERVIHDRGEGLVVRHGFQGLLTR